jgi:hypothetical protein
MIAFGPLDTPSPYQEILVSAQLTYLAADMHCDRCRIAVTDDAGYHAVAA